MLKHSPSKIHANKNLTRKILEAHKNIFDNFFSEIHNLPKLEKLLLENLAKLRKSTPAKLNTLAAVFMKILNSEPAFRISSLVDKFAYMGLFSAYCNSKKRASKLLLNMETMDFDPQKNPKDFSVLPDPTADLLRDSVLLLSCDLAPEREIILLRFISKLARIKPEKMFSRNMVPPERVLKRVFIAAGASVKAAKGDKEQDEEALALLKRRMRMAKLALKWLSVGVQDEDIVPVKEKKKSKKDNGYQNSPGDPFWTLNYISYKYRESINAQYNTLTAHYEPLNPKASNVFKTHPITNKVSLDESQLGQAFARTPTLYSDEPDSSFGGSPLTEEVFDASEWLAVQSKEYLESQAPLNENLNSDIGLRILRKTLQYMYGLAKLMRVSHRTQLKGLVLDSFYKILNPSLELSLQGESKHMTWKNKSEDQDLDQEQMSSKKEEQKHFMRHTAAQNIIMLHLVKLCRNKYDELRIVKHRDLTDLILRPLADENTLETASFVRMIYSPEEINAEPCLSISRNSEGLVEKSIAFYILMCKNKLYLNKEMKLDLFKTLDRNKSTIVASPFTRAAFRMLASQFHGAELSYYLEGGKAINDPPEALPEGLNRRQKNILYVQKVLKNIESLLEKQEKLDEKQTRFLNFGLIALKHHLLKGVDPELFTGLELSRLVVVFILCDKLRGKFRMAFLEIFYEYINTTKERAQLDFDSVKDLLMYFSNLDAIVEEEPNFAAKYYRTARLLLRIYPFEDNDLHNELAEGLQSHVFTDVDEKATLHADNLNLLVKVIMGDETKERYLSRHTNIPSNNKTNTPGKLIRVVPAVDADALQEMIFEFCRSNHRRFNIREIGLLLELLMYTENQGITLRNPKLSSLLTFLRLRLDKQKSKNILYCIDSLIKATKISPNFKEYLFHLNFELFFKLSLRKFINKPNILKPLITLFLQYTFALEENKFEMSESCKILVKQSKNYFIQTNDTEMVLLCLKSLVNSSLLRANSQALVNMKILPDTLLTINESNDSEVASISIALLFNIVFAFDKGEIKLVDLINDKMINLLNVILQNASLKKNDILVTEILDLFNAFAQHEYYNFFTHAMIQNLRFTLDNNSSHAPTIHKLLSLLRGLSLGRADRVRRLIKKGFGPRRLLALVPVQGGKKLQLLTKQITLSLLEKEEWTADALASEGLPENIIHNFSLKDDFSLIAANMKMIKLSLVSRNGAFYLRDHSMAILSHLVGAISIHTKSSKASQSHPEESKLLEEDPSKISIEYQI